MAKLYIGIDMSGRTVMSSIPSTARFSETKVVARGYGISYIAETVSGNNVTVSYYTDSGSGVLYSRTGSVSTNYSAQLPADFGALTMVDTSAVSYPYLSREPHGKAFLISEDMARVEGISAEQFADNYTMNAYLTSDSPISIATKGYAALIVFGFLQQIGSVILGVTKEGTTLNVSDLMTGTSFTSQYVTFTAEAEGITISTETSGTGVLSIVRGGQS